MYWRVINIILKYYYKIKMFKETTLKETVDCEHGSGKNSI